MVRDLLTINNAKNSKTFLNQENIENILQFMTTNF